MEDSERNHRVRAHGKPLSECAQTFMPYFHVIFTSRQITESEVACGVSQRKEWRLCNHNRGARPGMKHVAIDFDHGGSLKPFSKTRQ